MPYKDPEIRKAKAHARYLLHRNEELAKSIAHQREHRVEKREYDHERHKMKAGLRRAQALAWQKAHPNAVRARKARRRARKVNAAGTCTAAQLQARIDYYGGCCYVCLLEGKRTPYEAIDHVIPLAKGGSNWPANLRPICSFHNGRKGAKSLAEFLGN